MNCYRQEVVPDARHSIHCQRASRACHRTRYLDPARLDDWNHRADDLLPGRREDNSVHDCAANPIADLLTEADEAVVAGAGQQMVGEVGFSLLSGD